jgi:aspartyl-tRNA(Asn)/glutamyl-tRNA(Gln) amidotransferase subunit C
MPVTLDEVRHIAALARLGLSASRAESLAGELNAILAHMDVLSRVDTSDVEALVGSGDAGAPLRRDVGPPTALSREISSFGPKVKDGFFLVPRLATHEDAGDAS